MLGDARMGSFRRYHLPFPDHVDHVDAGQDDAGTPEILETQHRPDDAFDGPVVLLDNVVQILWLADLDRALAFGVDRLKRRP
ncbi:hypothetical protein OKW41_005113 [Paraburkholderia sp. UCT70]